MSASTTTANQTVDIMFSEPLDLVDAVDDILASPEYQSLGDDFGYTDYLSSSFLSNEGMTLSPMSMGLDDSPLSVLLNTPVIGEESDMAFLSGPSIYQDMPLFPPYDIYGGGITNGLDMEQEDLNPKAVELNTTTVFDTLSSADANVSPVRPVSPSLPSATATPAPTTRRKSRATGTRKNITPDSLLQLDAPTQPRKYVLPSVTSRKAVPALFAHAAAAAAAATKPKKRSRSVALGDDDDAEAEALDRAALNPDATVKEQIEIKRRQNTLAARKSRKRKLEHQRELEDQLKELTRERDMWKTRCETVVSVLGSHGIQLDPFDAE